MRYIMSYSMVGRYCWRKTTSPVEEDEVVPWWGVHY
jgi:hypothetical protein